MFSEKQTRSGAGALSLDGRTARKLLPHGHPFRMIDRVETYFPQERRILAVKYVSQNEPLLQGHFPDFPILPGVIIIEALTQASGCLMNLDYTFETGAPLERLIETATANPPPHSALVESRIKHTGPVYPGDVMKLESEIALKREGMYSFKVRALVDGAEVSKGQITLSRTPALGE